MVFVLYWAFLRNEDPINLIVLAPNKAFGEGLSFIVWTLSISMVQYQIKHFKLLRSFCCSLRGAILPQNKDPIDFILVSSQVFQPVSFSCSFYSSKVN